MSKNYDKLDIYTFGRQLIETRDLDPVYVLINEIDWDKEQVCNWLLAYWCFYHCGTASWIADVKDMRLYWDRMGRAAASKEFPRSSERRHFRGTAAITAVAHLKERLQGRMSISQLIDSFTQDGNDLQSVMKRAKQLRNFGDWIAFKIADMTERLGMLPVEFQPSDVFAMFEAPREGAMMLWEQNGGSPHTSSDNVCSWAHMMLRRKLGAMMAPPIFDRRINIQEIETILCKWKSHMNGHYEVGKDIKEIRHGLNLTNLQGFTTLGLVRAGIKTKLWSK